VASVTIESLAPGPHVLAAEYPGSDGVAASRGAIMYEIGRETPAIRWSAPPSIRFGTALGAAQLNAAADISGVFVYTPPAGTILSAGTQQLAVTFVPADHGDYEAAAARTTLVVVPLTPVVAASPVAVTYDGGPHPIAVSATGVQGVPVAGWFSIEYVPGGAAPPVNPGTYSALVTFHSSDSNYVNAAATMTVAIACAAKKARGPGRKPAWIRAHCRA
jgi:hypothetical protein